MVASDPPLIPVIAAVGYEILRFGARHGSNPIVVRGCSCPASWSRGSRPQPTDDMIEVAIVSMEEALRADGESPEPDPDLERDPMVRPSSATGASRAGHAAVDRGPRRSRPRSATGPLQPVAERARRKLDGVARQYDGGVSRPTWRSADPAALPPARQELARLEPVVAGVSAARRDARAS